MNEDVLDAAVRRGTDWLKTAASPVSHRDLNADELILYGLVVGGVPIDDPVLDGYLQKVVDQPPARTYAASIAALALAEIDEAGYRWKLEEFARFLVNTQCRNGQWGYGEALPAALRPPSGASRPVSRPPVVHGPAGPPLPYGIRHFDGRPSDRRVAFRRLLRGPKEGDNSNSQYAALGLRVCWEAGIDPDPACVKDALAWWTQSACSDGGWTYDGDRAGGSDGRLGRCSMTAGGVASLVVFRDMSGLSGHPDRRVVGGLRWLAKNWDVASNAGAQGVGAEAHHYYALFSLAHVGMLCRTDRIGVHAWYDEGARYLLEHQRADGSWQGAHGNEVHDTCFAILFLRQAARICGWLFVDGLNGGGKIPIYSRKRR